MPDSPIDVIAQVLRCSGVLLPNDFEGNLTYEQKIRHLAIAVDVALGGLTNEVQFKYTHLGTGKWTILESTDVQVARKIAGTTHELTEVERWVGDWTEVQ